MDKNTIIQLNQLNQQFYEQVATDFSASRSQAWAGWQQLLPYLKKQVPDSQAIKVLDIGCGNGRFAAFLSQQLNQPFNYWGVDNNQQLLDIAETNLQPLKIKFELIQLDLVDNLINHRQLQISQLPLPQLITLFGMMHHIPSYQLRTKMLGQLSSLLQPESLLIFTAWQFDNDDQFQHKKINPSQVGINADQLEPQDYILDWQRGQTAFRYCHHLDQVEIDQLLQDSNLELVANYQADGKSGQLNQYIIAKRKLRDRV